MLLSREEALKVLTAFGHPNVDYMTRRMAKSRLVAIQGMRVTDIDSLTGIDRETRFLIQSLVTRRREPLELHEGGWPEKPKKPKEVILPELGENNPLLEQTHVADLMMPVATPDPDENPDYRDSLAKVADEIIRRGTKLKGGSLDQKDESDQVMMSELVTQVQMIELPQAVLNRLGWADDSSAKAGESRGS